ncbi:MAG: hypothetical protein DUD26_07895 [Eubacteriaceae bacterium]|uniref:Uncharacterized protein n=1 Tax=Candidatus Pseudoramibacter fermentans TaxID=2594427 RepID=A0A6L5GSN2_9FIRM|nr:hypothetical protein [Candidatus Pseudoramibacter fermentans]RRF92128.1 MAG: hypothetical protein DUD26_07895 [Eubacteriaceae bacterium]
MSERKYTREQEELFEKIDEILLQNQSLKLSGLSEYDLTIYEEINEKDNDHITQSEALSYIKKIFEDQQLYSDHNELKHQLNRKLSEQKKLVEVILKSEDISSTKLNELNKNCCQLSILISCVTKEQILAQLTKQAAFCILEYEKDSRIVCAFILYYLVGLDQVEVATVFPGKSEESVSRKTIKRWLKKAIIEDLNPKIQKNILKQYHG